MINRTTQTHETELIRRLPAAERSIRDLKNKQLIGADSLPVVKSTDISITTVYTAGMAGGVVFNIYADVKRLYLSEVRVTFFLDNDNNDAYAWPYGASITPSMFQASQFYDWNRSDELGAGNKSYVFFMKNTDTVSHTVYMHSQLIYPSQELIV
ncbi:hypothetical protein QF038_001857 [Pseudarthrobacter sp. W1I19]|uniref:hypothetical protein n=1 Tax=Pseudarthrobacter sp. W1I19 TaxID=3042288 RepID=UPI002784C75B|nr:hypothetical protein [Pseudarthrobacter sp. W1I19]MDQ0923349.1 hypothetical protein [Pseudarthrobacter sp. W1I19]